MSKSQLYKQIVDLTNGLDRAIYPQSYEILLKSQNDVLDEEFFSAFSLAYLLQEADGTKQMEESVAEFVVNIYLEEIGDGNREAMTNLGALYYTGRCGEQSYLKAIHYYTMADKRGERQAAENLGYCYYYGRGVEQDYKQAFFYFLKAALCGNIRALYKIGDMYRYGYHVTIDEGVAFEIYSVCYKESMIRNDKHVKADCLLRMGDVFLYGIGVETNFQKAQDFYQKAEQCFYERIWEGDFYSQTGLNHAIMKQQEIRDIRKKELPVFQWAEKWVHNRKETPNER